MPRNQQIQMLGNGQIDYLLKKIGKELDNSRPGFEGERHMPMLDGLLKGYKGRFLGPGTHIEERLERGDKGINDVDEVAKQHDIDYMNIAKRKLNKKELIQEVKKADDKFITDVKKTKDAPMTAKIAGNLINLKSLAEGLNILPMSVFSGGKINTNSPEYKTHIKKLYEPTYLLKQEMNGGKQKGGVLPIVLAILGALSTAGASALGTYIGNKLSGTTSGAGINNPVELPKILKYFETIPKKKQISLLSNVIKDLGDEAFNKIE